MRFMLCGRLWVIFVRSLCQAYLAYLRLVLLFIVKQLNKLIPVVISCRHDWSRGDILICDLTVVTAVRRETLICIHLRGAIVVTLA